jgi:hypothetical protein
LGHFPKNNLSALCPTGFRDEMQVAAAQLYQPVTKIRIIPRVPDRIVLKTITFVFIETACAGSFARHIE